MSEKIDFNKKYWEENIEGFSGFYDTKSEENIPGNFVLKFCYKNFILPIEKKYMKQRHASVSDFIDNNVKNKLKIIDIGCGSGVYVKKMVTKGAFVYAYDYAQSALELTKRNLNSTELINVSLKQSDITLEAIPEVDIAVSIGVLPYISDYKKYLENILPHTNLVLFNFLDSKNFINRLRKNLLTFLDVRKYSYHSLNEISNELTKHNFQLIMVTKLATGFIIEAKRI